MTCRIDRLSTEQGLVLYISGRLAAEDLEVVRTALDGRRVVAVELAEVELVDRDAVKLLAIRPKPKASSSGAVRPISASGSRTSERAASAQSRRNGLGRWRS